MLGEATTNIEALSTSVTALEGTMTTINDNLGTCQSELDSCKSKGTVDACNNIDRTVFDSAFNPDDVSFQP